MSRAYLALIVATTLSAPARAEDARTAPEPTASPDGAPYVVKLRDLQRHVDELRDEIRRDTEFHGCVLPEWLLTGEAPRQWVTIRHEGEPGRSLRLTRATYFLDRTQIAARSALPWRDRIEPGPHTLSVVFVYQGKRVGPFSYLEGYKVTVRAERTFVVGKEPTDITIHSHEQTGLATALADRPTVDFHVDPSR